MNTIMDRRPSSREITLPATVLQEVEEKMLGQYLILTGIGYYPVARNQRIEHDNKYNENTLLYCSSGTGWFTVDNETRQLGAEQCVCLPAHSAHAFGSSEHDPWTVYWIAFHGKVAASYVSRMRQVINLQPNLISRIGGRIHLFEEMFRSLSAGLSVDSVLYVSTCLHHFLGTVAFVDQYCKINTPDIRRLDRIETTVLFMKENIEKRYTVDELARVAGYSVARFSTVFKARMGFAPIAYFNMLKIRHACKLLAETDLMLNQLCYKIGISDSFYFSRLFTKTMGMSPKSYRDKIRRLSFDKNKL